MATTRYSPLYTASVASETPADWKLVLTHHDPDHDDAFLRGVEEACRRRFPDAVLARERLEQLLLSADLDFQMRLERLRQPSRANPTTSSPR
jgi:hypothetical protein